MHTIWIVGASRDIGYSTALELASAGWNVAASARTVRSLEQLVRLSTTLEGTITSFPLDITDKQAVCDCIDAIENKMGPISHAFLATQPYQNLKAVSFDKEAFENIIQTNLLGTVNCLASLMERMVSRQLGRIVVLSSYIAYRGLPGWAGFGSASAALVNLCEAFYNELKEHNVKLAIINPGFFRADRVAGSDMLAPFITSLREASELAVRAIEGENFSYAIPKRLMLAFHIFRVLPYKFYFRFIEKYLLEESDDDQGQVGAVEAISDQENKLTEEQAGEQVGEAQPLEKS